MGSITELVSTKMLGEEEATEEKENLLQTTASIKMEKTAQKILKCLKPHESETNLLIFKIS